MIDSSFSSHRYHREARAPFSELTTPMSYIGEAIYTGIQAFADLVGQAYEAHKAKARERSTINELSALDNHVLKDIGVSRSDIPVIARMIAENPGIDPRTMRQQ